MIQFSVCATDNNARAGRLVLNHGEVDTPVFMPVGTQATVKGLTPAMLTEAGASMILANTYHLLLRPGLDVVESQGGLHTFMGWNGPILTDSGGFQVYSLAHKVRINDHEAVFASHVDGREIHLTPESVVDAQEKFGSDVIMPLDQCLAHDAAPDAVLDALCRTTDWARRSCEAYKGKHALFAIVQGGMDCNLRVRSAEELTALDLDGYAVGGLSVGEPTQTRNRILDHTVPVLPVDRPRYLMGVGYPADILQAIARGIDMFDCVLPTRNGRNGQAFVGLSRTLQIRNRQYRLDDAPLMPDCTCYTCCHFSRAYLRHLFQAKEMLGCTLVSIHNIHYYTQLVAAAREAIQQGCFSHFAAEAERITGASEETG